MGWQSCGWLASRIYAHIITTTGATVGHSGDGGQDGGAGGEAGGARSPQVPGQARGGILGRVCAAIESTQPYDNEPHTPTRPPDTHTPRHTHIPTHTNTFTQAADQFLAQLQEKERKLEALMRNVGLSEKATVQEALKELAAVKGQVAEESKPEVVHVPANLVLLKRDDILREGELVVVRLRVRLVWLCPVPV